MSGLVDIWTRELAKLREKGQTIFPNGWCPTGAESYKVVQAKGGNPPTGLAQALTRVMRVNSPVVLNSENSVSMLVECFSP